MYIDTQTQIDTTKQRGTLCALGVEKYQTKELIWSAFYIGSDKILIGLHLHQQAINTVQYIEACKIDIGAVCFLGRYITLSDPVQIFEPIKSLKGIYQFIEKLSRSRKFDFFLSCQPDHHFTKIKVSTSQFFHYDWI